MRSYLMLTYVYFFKIISFKNLWVFGSGTGGNQTDGFEIQTLGPDRFVFSRVLLWSGFSVLMLIFYATRLPTQRYDMYHAPILTTIHL